jgi:hypothetical protein
MKSHRILLVSILLLLGLVVIAFSAQSKKQVPRLSNGKPDFTGVWDHPRVADITKDANGSCAGETPGCKNIGSGDLPFTPAGKAENDKKDRFDYGAHCLPWGYVRSFATPYPHAYVSHPDRLAIMWEQDNAFHMVPTDGRPLPKDPDPSWRGTSVGHWDGDTLVIETVGFNGKTWLDTAEHPHSDQLKVTERLTRTDYDHINYELIMEDSKFYSKPIKNVRTFVLMKPGQELYEYSCAENNRCEGGHCTPSDVQK